MQALNKNSIKLKNENEKFEIIENLKNSFNDISSSPNLKHDSYNEPNLNPNYHNHKNLKKKLNSGIDKDNLPFPEKGKKHFKNHPSLDSNVNLVFKEKFDNSKERINHVLNYYKEKCEKDHKYKYSPQIHYLYNKEQKDPLQKYSEKARAMNLSNENPNYNIGIVIN